MCHSCLATACLDSLLSIRIMGQKVGHPGSVSHEPSFLVPGDEVGGGKACFIQQEKVPLRVGRQSQAGISY